MNKTLSQQERSVLARAVEDGMLADDFILSDHWIKLIGPFLREEDQKSLEGCRFKPGENKGDLEAVGLQTVFNSGMSAQIVRFREQLSIWVETGKEAIRELERDNKLLGEQK